MIERPDTRLYLIAPYRVGGYATVRNHRDLHGGFCDDRSELLCMRCGLSECIPAINMATRQNGKPRPEDVIGIVEAWCTDAVGLWCEVQLGNFAGTTRHVDYVLDGVEAGRLFYCLSTHPTEYTVDLATGYFSRLACWLVNVTEHPCYRPSSWPDADSYLNHLCDTCGDLPHYMSADNEETPLHAALPEGLFSYGS